MAKAKQSSDSTVTRITASDKGSSKPAKKQMSAKTKTKATKTKVSAASDEVTRGNIIQRFFGYFKGAWQELKQVRWPTRGATWSLTAAVLGFSAFFIVFILLLDAGFKYVFEVIFK